ncbi:MAG: DNA mismatch repair endonuclease MutL [Eubacteriales bacterium]|nr:DNA mismatch repair endonuclease MutL [Eubacteriales bacterium]
MADIQILSPFVADLIAAGEVVERPAAAVKELLENSLDAGAKNIVVELRDGGRSFIRVTDDGCGMTPEDAGIACLRHATSKLHSKHDLEAIRTFGFRGEALAAISAVGRVELTTRPADAETGIHVELDAGEITAMYETGCPAGTTFIVRDLFFNTPARLKFMGSDRSEGVACVAAAMRAALGRPDVSIRCIRDGKEEFFSPGDSDASSCVYTLLGRETASSLLPCRSEEDQIKVSGYVSAPHSCRGNRTAQYFFCNGRPIRSRTLTAALEQAYKNRSLTGRFPACVIYLEIPWASVDVNVHPAKLEVRFSDERRVASVVYYAALSALDLENEPLLTPDPGKNISTPPFINSTGSDKAARTPAGAGAARKSAGTPAAYSSPSAYGSSAKPFPSAAPHKPITSGPVRSILREAGSSSKPLEPKSSEPPRAAAPIQQEFPRFGSLTLRDRPADTAVSDFLDTAAEVVSQMFAAPEAVTRESSVDPVPAPAETPETILPPLEPPKQSALDPRFETAKPRLIGEALGFCILVELDGQLLLIDKHAVHERLLFDRMHPADAALTPQGLLAPLVFSPGEDDTALLLENETLLKRLGFELEALGENAVAVRAIPMDIDEPEAVPLLEELLEKLRDGLRPDAQDIWDGLAQSVACRAAIKAGRSSDPRELQNLVDAVCSGAVRYCPHGRPVFWALSREDIDKRFMRIV